MSSPLAYRAATRIAAGLALAAASACASTPGGSAPAETQSMQRGDRYLITADELANAGANNLYEAVVKLRPDFFKPRGNSLSASPAPASASRGNGPPAERSSAVGTAVNNPALPVRVYHDDTMLLGPEDLRQIPMGSVAEIRFIPGPQAGIRYGTNHGGGVVLVKSR